MPLTDKGSKILASMRKTYKRKGGDKKATSVFWSSVNSGKLKGVHKRQKGA